MIAVKPRDLLLLVGITFIWGFNLITSKVGVSEIPPILFTFLRFAIVTVVLLPVLRIHRGQMSALVVAALLSGAINFGLSFAALRRATSVSSMAIASQLGVPFATLLSVALLDEVVRWRRWTGILLSFAGVAIMGFDPQIGQRWESLAMAIAAAFMGALGLIAIKKLHGFRPAELLGWTTLISLPVLLVVTLSFEHPDWHALTQVSWKAWSALAFAAFGASLISYTGYFHLVQQYPVTSVAPLTTLSPIFSVTFGVLLLGDHLTGRIIIGGACTLVGVLIITLREQRIVDTGS
ncbi:MAG TPA: DMT family transporter [Steroidobacteraceae bacterium]|nr:DMT family transporter [Steroidobacteraceae bacterium]